MPTIDYTCQCCGHAFKRVVLQGDPLKSVNCPRCGTPGVRPLRGPARLFDGIAPFSRLARDRN
jgi:putative FmdB family regulatory protein